MSNKTVTFFSRFGQKLSFDLSTVEGTRYCSARSTYLIIRQPDGQKKSVLVRCKREMVEAHLHRVRAKK